MNEGDKQKIVDSVAAVTREGVGQVSAAQLDAGWERLESARSGHRHPSVPIVAAPSRWWWRSFAVATVVTVAVLAFRFAPRLAPGGDDGPLRYVLEGATVGPTDVITAGAAPGRLVFSDSSDVALAPGAVVSVASLDAHGSRIVLADGALDVRVHHGARTSWRFDAGPFTVNVRGTEFHMAFDAARGKLAVQMHTGVVEVQAPPLLRASHDRRVTLRAGESLELSVPPPHGLAVEPMPDIPAVGEKSDDPVPAVVEPRPAERPAASRELSTRGSSVRRQADSAEAAMPSPGAGSLRWSKLIAQGEFEAVVREAEDRGIDATLAGASAVDLTYLADAARYTKRSDLARQVLLDLRARFPGTVRASDAAFFLGRLAEQPQASAAAIAWYESYLHESPRGPYAGEALGREIALLARTDRAKARAAATTYLDRFPKGTQAELARSLVQSAP